VDSEFVIIEEKEYSIRNMRVFCAFNLPQNIADWGKIKRKKNEKIYRI
jgi:hypothetical protein